MTPASIPGDGRPSALLSTECLLTAGGDDRLDLDAATGLNRYGCPPRPDTSVLDFASSTASIISPRGFAAADGLRRRLLAGIEKRGVAATWERALGRLQGELTSLLGLADMHGLEILFAPSGTDLHLQALKLCAENLPVSVLLPEAVETGSGVPAILAGPSLRQVHPAPLSDRNPVEVHCVALRERNGRPRPLAVVEAEYAALSRAALTDGRRVLAVVADVSKTGLRAPSAASMAELVATAPSRSKVLVDACQARLGRAELRAWLEQGALVALTGSKFYGGPAFSGALLLPPGRFSSVQVESARKSESHPNFGLLLRWEAALVEMRACLALPDGEIQGALSALGVAIRQRLALESDFLPLDAAEGGAQPCSGIFPFLLRDESGVLAPEVVTALYKDMARDMARLGRNPGERLLLARRCRLGQAVSCGAPDGRPTGALRLALNARQVSSVVISGSAKALLDEATLVLEKLALLLKLRQTSA